MIFSLFLFLFPQANGAEESFILRPDAMLAADGSLLLGHGLLVQGDRIVVVGEHLPAPPGTPEHRLVGVLAPGFVDAFSSRGASGLDEASSYISPDFRAADALHGASKIWQVRLEQGITAVHLVPSARGAGDPHNLVAGLSAVVSTAGGHENGPSLLLDRARLTVSALEGPQRSREGGPGTLAGDLRAWNETVRPALAEALIPFPPLAWVDTVGAVRALRAQLSEARAWIALGDVGSWGGILNEELVAFVAPTAGALSPRILATLGRLHEAEFTLAFGSHETSNARSLRESAQLYSRLTGDPSAAWATITTNAAAVCGLSGKLGVLAAEARADMVLWSAHPLDSSAKLLAVMIGGRTVFTADSHQDS